jgi:hypothetical protein
MEIASTPQNEEPIGTTGLLRRVNREYSEDLEREKAELRKTVEEQQQQEHIIRLAGHIQTCWQAAKQAKIPIEERLLKCIRQRDGSYDPDIEALLQEQASKTGQPLIFMMLTNIKCRAAKAWIKDVMLPSGEKPFAVEPTPVPDLAPEIKANAQRELLKEFVTNKAMEMGVDINQITPDMIDTQELFEAGHELYKEMMSMLKEVAEDEAERMSDEINDDLKEGGWFEALEDTIEDVVDFPSGFLAGPILRKRDKLEWVKSPDGRRSHAAVVSKFVREWDSVSPFDLYPSPGARTLQDGYLIHICRFSPSDLNVLKDVPGFNKEAIEHILLEHPKGHRMHLTYETARADLEDREYDRNDPVARFDTIKYMGSVQGNILLEWGMKTDQAINPAQDYNIIAYMIAGTVISARLNPHPLGKRRYYKGSFASKNSSIWGRSVPELMKDVQSICNSAARAIVRNMAVASGPQTWVLSDRIPANVEVTEQHPWKLWQFTSKKMGTSGQEVPIGFFQPDPIVDVLLKLYDYFYKQASEVTGIPAYTYGSEQVGGAGKTASGLSMLMNAAAKGLKEVVKHIDTGIVKPSVYEDWLHIMISEPEKAGGDIEIVARASDYLIEMETLAVRRMEWLQATNNPVDNEIVGMEGRAAVLREGARSLKMPVDKVVPDEADISQMKIRNEIGKFIQGLSASTGISVEELMGLAEEGTQMAQGGGGNMKQLPNLDAAGNQMGGRDFALLNKG